MDEWKKNEATNNYELSLGEGVTLTAWQPEGDCGEWRVSALHVSANGATLDEAQEAWERRAKREVHESLARAAVLGRLLDEPFVEPLAQIEWARELAQEIFGDSPPWPPSIERLSVWVGVLWVVHDDGMLSVDVERVGGLVKPHLLGSRSDLLVSPDHGDYFRNGDRVAIWEWHGDYDPRACTRPILGSYVAVVPSTVSDERLAELRAIDEENDDDE